MIDFKFWDLKAELHVVPRNLRNLETFIHFINIFVQIANNFSPNEIPQFWQSIKVVHNSDNTTSGVKYVMIKINVQIIRVRIHLSKANRSVISFDDNAASSHE